LKKLWPVEEKEVKNSKEKTLNATKIGFQTPTKFLVCCYIVIKVQR
jgi:hypothetical protein